MPRHGSRSVGTWAWVLLALLAAHDLTHALDDGLRTGLGELAIVAVPQWLVLAAVMAVVLRGDRLRSAAAAFLLGLGATVGFAVVHLLPFAAAAYADLEPSAVSWLLVWVPPAVGLVLAALASAEWRSARRSAEAVAPGGHGMTSPRSA